MKKNAAFLVCCVLLVWASKTHAQVRESATRSPMSLTVGGIGSVFNSDYAGTGVPASAPNALAGGGAFVDFRWKHWLQVEGEARWLRLNQFENINEDNYLVGPRVPLFETRRIKPYAKALIGVGKMNFQDNFAYGHFTDIAFGGGVDFALTRKINVRALDLEYQLWPNWINGTLKPYGANVGVSYTIF